MNILINLQYFIKNDKLKIDMVDNCKKLIIKFRFRNKIYIEQFKQISKNNYELWECSSNSYLFSKKIYNIYNHNEHDKIELENLDNLINGKKVKYCNFTNNISDHDEWINEFAELL